MAHITVSILYGNITLYYLSGTLCLLAENKGYQAKNDFNYRSANWITKLPKKSNAPRGAIHGSSIRKMQC